MERLSLKTNEKGMGGGKTTVKRKTESQPENNDVENVILSMLLAYCTNCSMTLSEHSLILSWSLWWNLLEFLSYENTTCAFTGKTESYLCFTQEISLQRIYCTIYKQTALRMEIIWFLFFVK